MKRFTRKSLTMVSAALLVVGYGLTPPDVSAARGGGGGARGGGGGGGGGQARTSVNSNSSANVDRNQNVNVNSNRNQNVNVNSNRNVNVNRDVDIDVDDHNDWDHPVGAAMAVGAAVAVTAAAVGSIVYSVPPSCTTVVSNSVTYTQCGSTWYQPSYVGTNVQYVVVNPPY